MDGDDLRIAAVLQELAELGRQIGKRAGELARLTSERRRTAPIDDSRSDGTASVAAAAADLAAETARVVGDTRRPARPEGNATKSPSMGIAHGRATERGRVPVERPLSPPSRGRPATARAPARRPPRPMPRRSLASRGLGRLGGPLVASIAVHLVGLLLLGSIFIAADAKPMAVALVLGDTAEAGLDEAGLHELALDDTAIAEIAAEEAPESADPLEETMEPGPLEDLLAVEPLPMAEDLATDAAEEAAGTAEPTDTPAADAGEIAAGAIAQPAVEAGAIGGGKRGAMSGARAGRGKPAATFFGRAGQGKSVCFICDNSSSYRDGRFHAVLEELMRAVEGLRADQSFFVIFSSDAAYPLFHPEPAAGLQPATAENKKKLRAWLGTVEMCRGGQGIDDAVRLAATLDADCVYLLSDGELVAATVDRLGKADFGGATVHTFGIQGTLVDKRTLQPDPGKLFRQDGFNRNLASIAAAHGGTFTPVTVPPAAATLERLRPIPRNRSRGPVWGLKL